MDENKNTDWKAVPVYKDSPAAAREKNEMDAYRASSAANTACAKAIKEAIKENWTGSSLKEGCAKQVMDAFGPALTIYGGLSPRISLVMKKDQTACAAALSMLRIFSDEHSINN